MPLYVQLIYRRETRKIRLPYRVSAGEWISEREEVHIPSGSEGERSDEGCLRCNQSGILPLYNDKVTVCGYEICDVDGRQDRSVHRKEPVDHRGSGKTACAGDTELAERNHGGL